MAIKLPIISKCKQYLCYKLSTIEFITRQKNVILLSNNYRKMRQFCCLFLFLFLGNCTSVFTQNQRDEQGKKDGKWIYLNKSKHNSKIEEGQYLHGRKEGVWIKYHADGKSIKLKGTYKNNRPQGSYSRYYSNGVIREQGVFENNKYQGELTRYHKNGQLAYRGQFNVTGEEMGVIKYYYPNGQLEIEYTKINGKLADKLTSYYPNGSIKQQLNIVGGKIEILKIIDKPTAAINPVFEDEFPPKITNPITKGVRFIPFGYNKIYNDNDEIWQDGDFKEGRLFDGKVYVYDKNGILKKVKVFKGGKFHSYSQL